ncbi:MAG: 16S rRNA processing protein RimM [Clostridiales bacterium]|nr:16S rRNA processing protein RimM [Clostridiales bacterium]
MEKIKVGQIVNTKGIKGEVKIYPYTDYPERFEEMAYVYIKEEKYKILKVTYNKKMPILQIERINTIEDALKLKNEYLFIDRENLKKLDEDEYLIIDLIGLDVMSNGEKIGILSDVLTNTAQHIYVIKTQDRDILLPAVSEFIKEININDHYIVVNLVEGL